MKIEIELDELTKEEQETVKRLAKKKEKLYFVPKHEELYYYFGSDGNVRIATNYEDDIDRWNFFTGNCFKTEEKAKEAITRFQMQAKWKRLSLEAGEADNPWEDGVTHWYVYWDFCSKRLILDYVYLESDGCICFPSEKSLKAAIKELGEENVKKYILGVEG